MTVAERLAAFKEPKACEDAILWAQDYGDDFQRAWDECRRGDWLLWVVERFAGGKWSARRKKMIEVACECARLGRAWPGDIRPEVSPELVKLDVYYATNHASYGLPVERPLFLARCADVVRRHYPEPPGR